MYSYWSLRVVRLTRWGCNWFNLWRYKIVCARVFSVCSHMHCSLHSANPHRSAARSFLSRLLLFLLILKRCFAVDCRAEMASKEGIATRSADRPSSSTTTTSTRPMNHIHDSKDVERFTTKRKEGHHRTSSSRALVKTLHQSCHLIGMRR